MISRRDRFKLEKVYNRARLHKEQSLLIFLTCNTQTLSDELEAAVSEALADDFEIRTADLTQKRMIRELTEAERDLGKPTLFLIQNYPYSLDFEQRKQFDLEQAHVLNIYRDLIPTHDLRCVFLVSDTMVDTISREAPDFAAFRDHTARFFNAPDFQIPSFEHFLDKERAAFLEQKRSQIEDGPARTYLLVELAKIFENAYQLERAKQYLQIAQKETESSPDLFPLILTFGRLGSFSHMERNLDQADFYLNEAIKKCNSGDPRLGNIYSVFGKNLYLLGEISKGRYYLEESIAQDNWGGSENSLSFFNLSYLEFELGLTRDAEERADHLFKIFFHGKPDGISAKCLLMFGNIKFRRGSLDAAANFFSLAFETGAKFQDLQCIVDSFCGLFDLKIHQGEFEEAESILKKLHEVEERSPWSKYDLLLRDGLFQERTDQVAKALVFYRECLAYLRRVEMKFYMPKALVSLSRIYAKQAQNQKAHDHFQEALEKADEMGLAEPRAQARRGLGILAAKDQEQKKALDYLNQALEIEKKMEADIEQGFTLYAMGRLFLDRLDGPVARRHFEQALEHLQNRAVAKEAKTLYRLGQTHELQDDPDIARRYYKRALSCSN